MARVGSITFGVQIDTEKFEKQLSKLEADLKKEEDKGIEYEIQINTKEEQIERAKKGLEKLPRIIEETNAKMMQLATEMDNMDVNTPEYDLAKQKLDELVLETQVYEGLLKRLPSEISRQETQVDNLKNKQEQVNQKVEEYKQKIENVKVQQQVAEVDKIKKGFSSVGNSIQQAVGKVARLALGIFALRSAVMAVRQASSTLASYDKQYAANIEYIRFALTQMIAPVLRYIVNLVATILSYIYAILNAWFGIGKKVDVSAKAFQKMKGGASGAVKAVKELKKQLAGFDEINMLSDQSDSGGGGGGAGGAMPNFDLSALNVPRPPWLEWIINNKDLILAVMAGIASALLAWKLGLDAITSLGIGVLVAGIVFTIQALLAYLKDPSWTNFGKIIQGIGVAVAGLGILIGSVPAVVIGAIVLIVGTIIRYWEKIKAFLQKGIDWLRDRGEVIREKFGDTVGDLYDMAVRILQSILDWLDNTFTNLKNILDGIIQFVKGVFTRNWSMAWEGIKKIAGAVWDWILNTVIKVFQSMNDFIQTKIQVITNLHNKLWEAMRIGASNALNFIKSIFSGIANWFGGVINNIINMFRNFGTRAGEVIGGAFKGAVNGVLRAIESILNTPIRAINNLISTINAVPRNKSWLLKNI